MSNYEISRDYARGLFLKWDQEKIIARCGLRADEDWLYTAFLGQPFRIQRATGAVENLSQGRLGDFSESLSIYDYLCRETPIPRPAGKLMPVNGLRHAAKSSPDAVSFHQKHADFFQNHQSALKQALGELQLAPFPQGDAACYFPVFDRLTAVFQFWEGDEEFPPSVRFLWDETTPDFLMYETIYYVMGCFLDLLRQRIGEIEKNC